MKETKFKQFRFNLIDRIYCCEYWGPNGKMDPQQIINYMVSQDQKTPLTQEQWRSLFSLCRDSMPLAKWMIEEHYDLAQEAIGLIVEICDENETSVYAMEEKKEIIAYIYEHAPEENRIEILGTAFVLTCKNNNLYLIKWLLEQGVDVEYRYNGQTGMEAALKNIKDYDGIEDKNIVHYLENNIHKKDNFDDVKRHYRNHFYEKPKKEVNIFLTGEALELAKDLLEDEYPTLLDEETSAEDLHLFMEDYNWDDGIEIPYFIMLHPNCELATALMIFWLAEGGVIFKEDFEDMYFINEIEYKYFIRTLHDRILNGKYSLGKQHYRLRIREDYKEELRRKKVNEVFLTDL